MSTSAYWGAAIPGLAMNAQELPDTPGLLRLQNLEIEKHVSPEDPPYTLRDVAAAHLATLQKSSLEENLLLIGMSMGGMVLSILATDFREALPRNTRFRFLVTSSNSKEHPAIPDRVVERWKSARPGDVESFRRYLEPFFSESFRKKNPQAVEEYFQYRANGGNGQSARAFMRQMQALRTFNGKDFFPRIRPREAEFFGGAEDHALGPAHNALLRKLLPQALHQEIAGLGHMVNIEMPELFEPKFIPPPMDPSLKVS